MSRALDTVRASAIDDLLQVRLAVEHTWLLPNSSAEDRERSAALGRSLFVQLSRICKLALDARDVSTFVRVEDAWSSMFEDTWVYDDPRMRTPEQQDLAPLLLLRDVLRLGVAMWAVHLLSGPHATQEPEAWREGLRRLADRFTNLNQLLDVYEAALERDSGGESEWTSWFLGELDEGQAHVIPTRGELLTTTLIIGARFAVAQDPVRPREWMRHSAEDIEANLNRLDEDAQRWSWLVADETVEPEAHWHDRIVTMRELLHEARDEELERQAADLRQSPVDPVRVRDFQSLVRTELAGSRVIRDTFRRQNAFEAATNAPAAAETLLSRTWLPKTMFVPATRVHGYEHIARTVGREANAETRRLVQVLGEFDVEVTATDAPRVRTQLSDAISNMRDAGMHPSLLLLPLAWRLKERLGLPLARSEVAPDHPLIPITQRTRFAGLVDDVPAIDLPRVPDDRFYLLDLRAALTFVEWPSEDDAGVEITLRSFDEGEAHAFIRDQPAVVAEGQTPDDTARLIQERVLLELRLSWTIRAEDQSAVRTFSIPEELERRAQ